MDKELQEALKDVMDPELGYSVLDLGLIYRLERKGETIEVDYTLTSPGCPMGPELEADIVLALAKAGGGAKVKANLVWQPYWTPERASDELRVELGYPIAW